MSANLPPSVIWSNLPNAEVQSLGREPANPEATRDPGDALARARRSTVHQSSSVVPGGRSQVRLVRPVAAPAHLTQVDSMRHDLALSRAGQVQISVRQSNQNPAAEGRDDRTSIIRPAGVSGIESGSMVLPLALAGIAALLLLRK
jgi:hypothetical protein